MTSPPAPAMPADPGSDETIFAAALQWEAPAQRAAYLDEACAGSPELRARIEALLQASEAAPTFLERPVGVPRTPAGGTAPTVKVGFTELLPADEGPGTKIGRYKLLQQIGEGGCGTIFMAEQEEPVRRRVALKVIKLGMDTKQIVARFFQSSRGLMHSKSWRASLRPRPSHSVLECAWLATAFRAPGPRASAGAAHVIGFAESGSSAPLRRRTPRRSATPGGLFGRAAFP